MLLLMSLRFCCCFSVRLGEKLIMGKYTSALGKVDLVCLTSALSCLMEVCLGSWSLLLSPMDMIMILTDELMAVFSHIFRKW